MTLGFLPEKSNGGPEFDGRNLCMLGKLFWQAAEIVDWGKAHFTKKAKVCPNIVTKMGFNLVLKSTNVFCVARKCKEGDILRSFGGGHHFCGSVVGHRAQLCMEKTLQQHGAEVEPNISRKKLSACNRRIIVTRLVAKAHKLTVAGDDAKRWQILEAMGYSLATHSDIKLPVFPRYTFVPMFDVKQHVRATIDARARREAVDVPEEAPIRLPPFKAKQKPIT